ncbi:MAG: phosphatase PAP2 family protein, partial [Hydrogenophaga sp.]|nr:phosphatase PAP2 family protein [Hydrogenophaga sp.]
TELVQGLSFPSDRKTEQAGLAFTDLDARTPRRHTLLMLRAPDRALLEQQMTLVAAYADLRGDRGAEILAQMGPPIDFWAGVVGLQPHRHKKTLQVLDLCFGLAVHVEMRFKHMFAVVRPMQLSPQIQPMIADPGHAAWPSGHATEAFIVAHVLSSLLKAARPGKQQRPGNEATEVQLQRLAARIAVNRTVAGVHYPVDSAVGRMLGTVLGQFLVARSQGGTLREHAFDGLKFQGTDGEPLDFQPQQPLDSGAGSVHGKPHRIEAGSLLSWLWQEAIKEWQ